MTQQSVPAGEWMARGRLAPYVRARKTAGDVDSLVESAQPAGDMSDPPYSDLCLIRSCSPMSQRSDLGAGRFEEHSRAGALFLIPPHVATDIVVHGAHVIRTAAFPVVRFRAQLEGARGVTAPFDFGPLHRGHFDSPVVIGLFDRLWAEADCGNPDGLLLAEALSLQLLVELSRLAGARTLPARGGLAPWQLRRCCEYLRDHVAEDVALDELARLAGLSTFHFARMFKVSTGLPPHAYQRRLRCERARELLLTTDLPVIGIALAVGYDTPQAFARMFRAETGTTPSAWRRERRL